MTHNHNPIPGSPAIKPAHHPNDKSVRVQRRYLTQTEIDDKAKRYLAASQEPVHVSLLPTWIDILSTCTRPTKKTPDMVLKCIQCKAYATAPSGTPTKCIKCPDCQDIGSMFGLGDDRLMPGVRIRGKAIILTEAEADRAALDNPNGEYVGV